MKTQHFFHITVIILMSLLIGCNEKSIQIDENEALARSFVEAWSTHDTEANQMILHSMFFKVILLCLMILSCTKNQVSTPSDITIDRNGVLLKGKVYIPEGRGPFPTVILLKGFYDPQDDVLGIGKILSEAGFVALTFQYSGTDKSQGEFSFKNTQKDIQAAFEFIHQPENIRKYKIDTTRIHLGGLSYGGGMALTYAADHPGINSIFSIAGTDHGEFIREYMNNSNMRQWFDKWIEGLAAPKGPVRIVNGFSMKAIVEMGIKNYLPTLDLKKSAPFLAKKHILLIGGWDDTGISLEHHLLPLYRTLKNENAKKVKITAVQDNHSFENSGAELAQIIIKWLISIEKEEK